jgi:hypothetical protein
VRLVATNVNGSKVWQLECMNPACRATTTFTFYAEPTHWARQNRWMAGGDDELCPRCAATSLIRVPAPAVFESATYDFRPIQ